MKNHEIVPTPVLVQLSGRVAGCHRILSDLSRNGLVAKVPHAKYDGYRLTYGGLDYLALKAFCDRGTVSSVGTQIGIGKESDIVMVASEDGT